MQSGGDNYKKCKTGTNCGDEKSHRFGTTVMSGDGVFFFFWQPDGGGLQHPFQVFLSGQTAIVTSGYAEPAIPASCLLASRFK